MSSKYTIKQILTTNQNWWKFYQKNKDNLRPSILTTITKLLSCKNKIRGYHEYTCSNPNCSHIKYIPHTCKCKACSSCGSKATKEWVSKQNDILPRTSWQHITFTMPQIFWDCFWNNRFLLNKIGKIAADVIQKISKKRGITVGIFIAIHTFGRDLKKNVHIHLSTTTGGLADDNSKWKDVFFKQETIMKMWRYEIINLFRDAYKNNKLVLTNAIKEMLNPTFTFNSLLNRFYNKRWIVHCAKPSANHKINVEYLGRYTKRPAIAESKLRHFDGNEVAFKYLDHTTKTYRKVLMTAEEFIGRFVRHIPDANFRMIRYYGFLANRVRGKLLPLVYALIGDKTPKSENNNTTHAILMKKEFGLDPLSCILCGSPLFLSGVHFGKGSITNLLKHHRQLALLKRI